MSQHFKSGPLNVALCSNQKSHDPKLATLSQPIFIYRYKSGPSFLKIPLEPDLEKVLKCPQAEMLKLKNVYTP